MTIAELLEKLERDSKIDETNLDRESLRIALLHGAWYSIFMTEARVYRSASNDLKRLRRQKTEYYLGKAQDSVYEKSPLDLKVLRQDLDLYLDSDEEIIALDEKVNTQKLKVEMIESFIKSLNSRGFNIKSAIDFLKFKNGTN